MCMRCLCEMRRLPAPVRIIPHVVQGQTLITLPPEASVRHAVEVMAQHAIGAILVVGDEGQLVGIFTERDVVTRVLAPRRDPADTPIRTVSTSHPHTLAPSSTARHALRLMHTGHFRHLPVVDKERVVGIVSIRDLYAAVLRTMEEDLLDLAGKLIRG
jgi:CBS domain-containing protein